MNNSYFEWDDDLLTGMALIDSQHQGLIETINEALQLYISNEKIQVYKIENIYKKLKDYVSDHFRAEEQIMFKYSIDSVSIKKHIALHRDFEMNIEELFSDIPSLTNPDKLQTVGEFLIRWLAYHILNTDKSLVRQINAIKLNGVTPQMAYEKEENYIESTTEPLLKTLKVLFNIVSEKNSELRQINIELEDKINQRTQELLNLNKKLELLSMSDELTGLPNRRYAISILDQLINDKKRYGGTFSLLFIDVDKFKNVNDHYGHEYGDRVLIWIAEYLKMSLRKSDIPCRLGGDEFLVICSHCDGESAMSIASKINQDLLENSQQEIFKYWTPSFSIGVAEVDKDCHGASDILNKADDAMYEAKNAGGGFTVHAKNEK